VIRRAIVAVAFLLVASCASQQGSPKPCAPNCPGTPSSVTVFAAASLQPAFEQISRRLIQQQFMQVTYSYAGTQTLTSQLTQGAQADVFASADTAHMTILQTAGLIAGTPKVFAHNRLEIAVERGNPKNIHTLADLARPGLVVVLADPSVPAGKYAKQALASAGVTVHPASLETQVTGVLSKVALGEADAGIVYVSDIVTSGKVDGIAIPDSQNVIADYPIAKLSGAQNKTAADAFIAYALSPEGQSIMVGAGFEKV
jgi:molybdate transport system substrate-binding protein